MLASACQAAAARRRVGRGASPPRDKEEDSKNEREEKEGSTERKMRRDVRTRRADRQGGRKGERRMGFELWL